MGFPCQFTLLYHPTHVAFDCFWQLEALFHSPKTFDEKMTYLTRLGLFGSEDASEALGLLPP